MQSVRVPLSKMTSKPESISKSEPMITTLNQIQKPLINAEFSKNAKLYDSVAKVQRKIADRLVSLTLLAHFKEQTHELSILDAGCGTGYVGFSLCNALSAQKAPESKLPSVTALDLSKEMLEVARMRNIYEAYYQGDIEALPFADSNFDLVLSSLAIQWCHEPQRAISELVRVAKSTFKSRDENEKAAKPSVIISTLVEGSLHELISAFKTIDDEKHVIDFISESALSKIVEQYGGKVTIYKEVMHFESLKSLFKSLKNIGATALKNRRKGLLGRESYQKLEQFFKNNGGYQLTYTVALIEIP